MSTQRAEQFPGFGGPDHKPNRSSITRSENRTAVEGLEDLFKWASEMVADGEDLRVKEEREHRIRRQVLDAMQKLREGEATARAAHEIAYLQRRVIALLQKLQDLTEENATVKSVMVAQAFELQRVGELEKEVKQLREIGFEREGAEREKQALLDALAAVKVDRDFLDELLRVSEDENSRLARLLADTRADLDQLRSRRWWHIFWPPAAN